MKVALALLVVDDHRAVAEALAGRLRLEPDFHPVLTAHSYGAAVAALDRDPFDVVVTDIELGRDDGVELVHYIRQRYDHMPVVVLTAHDDVPTAFHSLQAGARAFVPKGADALSLIEAIRGAVRGETHIPPLLLTGVMDGFRVPNSLRTDLEKRVARLTAREREVLLRLAAGDGRGTIATNLFLSRDTVRTHIKNILAKLEVHSTVEAVGLALKVGIDRGQALLG